jgi:PAS domain S-box-containing protein
MEVLARGVELRRKGDTIGALGLIRQGDGKSLMDAARERFSQLVQGESARLAEIERTFGSEIRKLQMWLLAACAVAVLCSLSLVYFLYRRAQQRTSGLLLEDTQQFLRRQQNANAELTQANTNLRASEERLNVTLNSIGDAVMATDSMGYVTLLNPTAEKLSGWTFAQAAGRPANEVVRLVDGVTREAVALPVMRVLTDGVATEMSPNAVLLAQDGAERAIDDSCSAIRDSDGHVIGAVLVFRDVTTLRAYERQLEVKSDEQRTILDAAPTLIFYKDAANRYLNVNEAMARAHGTSKAELIGKTCWEIYDRVLADGYWQADKEVIASRQPRFKVVERLETANGCVLLETDRFPYLDADGTIIGVIGFGVDVTARKHAEDQALSALRESEARFRQIANSLPQLIWTCLPDGPCDFLSEQWLTFTGIPEARQLGFGWLEGLHPDDRAPTVAAWQAAVDSGSDFRVEFRMRRKDGTYRWFEAQAVRLRDEEGQTVKWFGSNTDISSRKESEEAQKVLDQKLQNQQFYSRSLLEASIDALMTTDPKGNITDVNKQMEALTGRTRNELIGSSVKDYFTDPKRAADGITRVLAEQRVTDYELTARAKDGTEIVVSYNATTFYDQNGQLQGVFAAAREMTELKRFEQALKQKNLELEQATRMKSEFLATMSHELRTPLNAIIGFSEALKDGLVGDLGETQKEYIGDIYGSGQHLLSLINDILDLSKVEAGMMHLELEPTDLQSLFASSMMIVKEKAASRQIHLELEVSEDLGVPRLDIRKTKQIIYNLLANAVKFTPTGGRAILRARRVPRSVVGTLAGVWPVRTFSLADSECQEFLEICVSDNGIGIAEDDLERLFRPFSQIDSSLGRRFEGTGLGLATVKQLAELHGGSVAVSSAMGQGSTFAAWLALLAPRDDGNSPVHATDAATFDAARKDRVALVVEEDPQAAELMRLLLQEEGFTVLCAATAEAALLLAPQQPLSLITLDLRLTGIDGWEFLDQLRTSSTVARVPVLVFGGDTGNNAVLTGGPAAVLQKPVSRRQLHASLDHLGLKTSPLQARTVLVVDDDPKAVEVMAAFLPAPAYAVVRAYGGEEAIGLSRRLRPDLIVLDLMMPNVSGFDVVEALQRDGVTAHIPVLVVTAKTITAEDRAALSRKPSDIIRIVEKAGFDRLRFIAEVRRALAKAAPSRPAMTTDG